MIWSKKRKITLCAGGFHAFARMDLDESEQAIRYIIGSGYQLDGAPMAMRADNIKKEIGYEFRISFPGVSGDVQTFL